VKKGILIIGVCLLALSCAEEGGTGPGPAHPEATSPANVLRCVEVSFNGRDAVLLDDMLAKAFTFHFAPYDIGRNPPGSNYVIPESWSETEFRRAVRNMLDEAYSISFVISTDYVGEPRPEETYFEAKNVRLRLLVMIDEINGYLADAGHCNFGFERYDGEEGEKLWRLTDWWDYTAPWGDANPGTRPSSFGEILAKFY
jgi:hypothetical protein